MAGSCPPCRGPLRDERGAAAIANLIADLDEAAGGRIDLLARQAGLAIGCHEHDSDAAAHLQIAQLCLSAGADLGLISHWIDEGRRLRTATHLLPPPGLAHLPVAPAELAAFRRARPQDGASAWNGQDTYAAAAVARAW